MSVDLDLKNIPNAPQPGTPFSVRKQWMDNTRFIDVRNLAAYSYPNPDGSKLMQYNDTLADAEIVIKTLLHYELSNGLIVDDGTAQAYFSAPTSPPESITQQVAQPPAAPQPAAPAGAPQMSFTPPAFGQPQQAPQQPQYQQQPPQQFAPPPGAVAPPSFAPQPPNAAQAAQAAGGPAFQQQPPPPGVQPMQQPQPPAPEPTTQRAGKKSKGAAVAPPPAAPPAPGPVQTFIPGTGPAQAPSFGAQPSFGQPVQQAPQFGQQPVPQTQTAPQAFGQPQQQQAAPLAPAPVAIDLSSITSRLDAIGAGLMKDSADKDSAIANLKVCLEKVHNTQLQILVALNHIYLSTPQCKAQAESSGYKDGTVTGFVTLMKSFIP